MGLQWMIIEHARDAEKMIGFVDVFTGPGVAMLVLMIIGVLLMVPTVGEVVFRPNRNGIVWLARFFHLGYGTAGQIFRLLLANITAVVAGLIWTHTVPHFNTDITIANSLYRTRSSVPWAHYEHRRAMDDPHEHRGRTVGRSCFACLVVCPRRRPDSMDGDVATE
jgi:hypothetical protein